MRHEMEISGDQGNYRAVANDLLWEIFELTQRDRKEEFRK